MSPLNASPGPTPFKRDELGLILADYKTPADRQLFGYVLASPVAEVAA